jgi:flagellar hook-associated protein 3 FlgL
VQLGNTKFGDEYLFGGDASTTAPFSSSGLTYTSTNPTGHRTIAIGQGQTMTISHTGTEVFVSTGVLDSLQKLGTALAANDVAGINTASQQVSSAFDNVQGIVGDVGARGNQLNMTSTGLDSYESTITAAKSNIEDIDPATAITELTSRQTAYQAALLAVSKTTSLNLTDYLT